MRKMSIHRALSELKVIDSRIAKAIEGTAPVGYMQKNKPVNNQYTKEDFDKKAKASLQSANALIELKDKIKSAIVKANSETIVKIGNTEMTIADAITQKNNIQSKQNLLYRLQQSYTLTKKLIDSRNLKVEESATSLAETALGKENVKIGEKDTEAIMNPFIDSQKYELVDPLDIETLIQELDDEIVLFEAEVDATLSEINATTFIEVGD